MKNLFKYKTNKTFKLQGVKRPNLHKVYFVYKFDGVDLALCKN